MAYFGYVKDILPTKTGGGVTILPQENNAAVVPTRESVAEPAGPEHAPIFDRRLLAGLSGYLPYIAILGVIWFLGRRS